MMLRALLQSAGLLADVGDDAVLDLVPAGVSADSRAIQPGWLFVAVPGTRTHGVQHVADAVVAGACAVVADVPVDAAVPVIAVSDAQQALGRLACAWYGHPSRALQVIGITGTNGKTTTALLVAQLLSRAGLRCAALGTLGLWTPLGMQPGQMTTPDAMTLQRTLRELVDAGYTHLAMEVSSHALAQGRVAGMQFATIGWTNLTQDHLDYHGDLDSYAAAKLRLFTDFGVPRQLAFVNADSERAAMPWDAGLAEAFSLGAHPAAEHQLWQVRVQASGLSASLRSPGRRDLTVSTPLVGRHNAENLALALLLARAVGAADSDLADAAPLLQAPRGRLEPVPNALGVLVLVDYAHTPDALQQVLQTLKPLVAPGRRLVVAFGCGGDRDRAKRPLMGEVAARLADLTVVTSDNPRTEEPAAIAGAVVDGLVRAGAVALPKLVPSVLEALGRRHGFVVELDREAAIRRAIGALSPGDVLCIAGKGHETTQTIGSDIKPFDDAAVAATWLSQRRPGGTVAGASHKQVSSGAYRFSATDAVTATGGRLVAAGTRTTARLCTDSRQLQADDLFVALRGEQFDGGAYAVAAVEAGAAGVVCEASWADAAAEAAAATGAWVLAVDDALLALEGLSIAFRRRFDLATVGVTGSNGKTTTKELTALALAPLGPVLATAGNFNNRIGVPLTVARLTAEHKAAVIEMGMSIPGEIRRLARMGWPQIGIVTSIGEAHLEGMGSVRAIAEEKLDLCRALPPSGVAILAHGQPDLHALAPSLRCKVLWFGLDGGDAHAEGPVQAVVLADGQLGLRFVANVLGESVAVELPGLGVHLAHNALAALLAAQVAGVRLADAAAQLRRYQPVGQRMLPSRVEPWLVLEDCYNANPASTKAALRTLAGLPGPRAAVLGAMLELGPTGPELHAQVAAEAAALGIDAVIALGDCAEHYQRGATEQMPVIAAESPEHAAALVAAAVAPGGTVLVKGSRGARMERVIAALRALPPYKAVA